MSQHDSRIETLERQLQDAYDLIERLRDNMESISSDQYLDLEEAGDYLTVDADKYEVAEAVIDREVTPEMLKMAAQTARLNVEAVRDVYIEGALLGINTMREALLDQIASKGKKR